MGGLLGQVTYSRHALINWNKCLPDKIQHKCGKASYAQCLWSWLPEPPSNACGWADICTHKKDWRYCVHTVCVYTQILSGICLLCFALSSLMEIKSVPQTGNIRARLYIWIRFCSADGRTQICKVSLYPAVQGKWHFSNSMHLCNSRNQEKLVWWLFSCARKRPTEETKNWNHIQSQFWRY